MSRLINEALNALVDFESSSKLGADQLSTALPPRQQHPDSEIPVNQRAFQLPVRVHDFQPVGREWAPLVFD